jgi:hypothetical protein
MQKAEDYRRHAKECMRLAKQMDREEHRVMLESMAQIWLRMAEDRARHIDRHPHAA